MKYRLDQILQFVRPMRVEVEDTTGTYLLKSLSTADVVGLGTVGAAKDGDDETVIDQRVMGYIASLFDGDAPLFLSKDLRTLPAPEREQVRKEALALLDFINKLFIAQSLSHEKKELALAAEEADRQISAAFGATILDGQPSSS